MKLSIKVFGIDFSHPLFLPSGIITEIADHKKAEEAGAAMIVLKSITIEKRDGYPAPRVIKYHHGFLNAVGLRNPGLSLAKQEITLFLKKVKVPVVISLFASKIVDFQKLVYQFIDLQPAAIELNLSCPHVTNEFGRPLAMDKEISYQVTKIAKREAGKIPLICKLTPNIVDIGEIAKACEAGGASAIAAINTVGPGMVIDIKKRKPVLGNKKGGVSGPGIKPIAIAKVYEIYQAVKIPILGMGGVVSWQDAIEMMMAGASLVGVGSAIYLHGFSVFQEILSGIKKFMEEEKITDIKSLVGVAHN